MTLASRIGEALRKLAPDDNKSGWMARHADELSVGERTFKAWYYGESDPGGSHLLTLFDHFGADFEREVRGDTEARELTPNEHIDKATHHMAEAKRGLKGVS